MPRVLLGYGSDVLGYDTERSTDHGWGPRLQVLVADDHDAGDIEVLRRALADDLPETHRGWPVRFGWDDTPVQHHVAVVTIGAFFEHWLGFDPRAGLDALDWLSTPSAAAARDDTRRRVPRRPRRHHAACAPTSRGIPNDVWLWMLACQWRRLDQEEPFVGRTAEVGDDSAAACSTARLARDVMALCFLHGTGVRAVPEVVRHRVRTARRGARGRPRARSRALAADTIARSRGRRSSRRIEAVARRHNALGITDSVDPTARLFYGRPFRVLGSERFVDACLARVTDERLRSLPLIGGVDQWSDSTDVRSKPAVFRRAQRALRLDVSRAVTRWARKSDVR